MDISITVGAGVALVEVSGDVDLEHADELSTVALAAMTPDVSKIVVDLSGVSFLDSTGLNALIRGFVPRPRSITASRCRIRARTCAVSSRSRRSIRSS